MAICIVSAQCVLLIAPTSRGWPFSPVLIYQHKGPKEVEAVEIRVWDESGERNIIAAGLSHYQLRVPLTHRARNDDEDTRQMLSDYLKAVAQRKNVEVRGVRFYSAFWNIAESRRVREELVFEDIW